MLFETALEDNEEKLELVWDEMIFVGHIKTIKRVNPKRYLAYKASGVPLWKPFGNRPDAISFLRGS